eukprot:gene5205-5443_t
MASNPLKRPAMKLMKVVLSNGAHLAMPTPALKTRPFYATQDLFQHNAWAVKVAGLEGADAARAKKVDFSAFYSKFGMDAEDNSKW